ncbi:MAG: aspartate/glutamate racemase family protein, partial [Oscillospiraceae bacterium]|nr:aspartate/glutamate racemase family protein [Oscillospiraceae bacterium]
MAIGIFDSGVGGLSMVRAVDSIAPSADLIYLGDTARVPYGLKTTEQLEEITADNFRFMIDAGVEKVFIACGTISSLLCNKGYPDMGIPYVTVIDATAKSA